MRSVTDSADRHATEGAPSDAGPWRGRVWLLALAAIALRLLLLLGRGDYLAFD